MSSKRQTPPKRRSGRPTKILVAIDGSPFSDRAVDYAIDMIQGSDEPLDLQLVNVQIPIDSGHARMFATAEEIDAYHREEGEKALAGARAKLDAAGIDYGFHILVGHVARTIARFAKEQHCDKLVMGTHGRSGLTQLLLGSVAQNVVRRLKVPVALVK